LNQLDPNPTLKLSAYKASVLDGYMSQHSMRLTLSDLNDESFSYIAKVGHSSECMRLLFCHKARVLSKDIRFHTFHQCIKRNHNTNVVIKLLLDHNDDFNAEMAEYILTNEPIRYSALMNDLKLFKLLLESGADINAGDAFGWQPIHTVAGNLSFLGFLLNYGVDVNAATLIEGRQAIHIAAGKNLKCLKLLLKHGADLNSKTTPGLTPIHFAAKYGHLDILKFIIDSGCEMNVSTNDQNEASHMATMFGKSDCLSYLIDLGCNLKVQNSDGDQIVHLACFPGTVNCMKILFYRGADIYSYNQDGFQPLHCAALYRSVNVLKFLLDIGVDPKSLTCGNDQAIHLAFGPDNNLDCLKLLIDYGADVNAVGSNGMSPIMTATINGTAESILILALANADVNQHTFDEGLSSLHLAARHGQTQCIALLISLGSNINALSKDGFTPLSFATMYDHVETILELLEFKADINLGLVTPLYIAWKYGNERIINLLIEAGAEKQSFFKIGII
jgi:ankyrin repeat protein